MDVDAQLPLILARIMLLSPVLKVLAIVFAILNGLFFFRRPA